jgi:PDZ domain-containing protein
VRFSPLPKIVTATLGIFLILGTIAPLPFAIVLPGQAQNIFKGVITIKDLETFPATGRIDLMSIRVTNPDTWIFGPELIYSWISAERAVYPKSAIYPPGTSAEEESKQAKADMVGSQDNAIIASVNYLQSHPEILASKDPAESALVDGAQVLSASELKKAQARANALDPKKISFKVEKTGGPSGGLVFSIGLVELLTELDLMQGRHIAGTGTIDNRGVVGPIGGINEKILSAKKVGATIFFAPVGNAEEISNVPDGIKVVTVATLAQAISYLARTATKAG